MKTYLKHSAVKLDRSASGYRPVNQESENMDTMDTQEANTATKRPHLNPLPKRDEKIPLPPPSTPILEKSETSSTPEQVKEDVTPDDSLTRAQQKVADVLTGWYAAIGLFTCSADMYDGLLILKSSRLRAEEIVKVCRHNKQAWSILVKMTEASDTGKLITGHGLMLYAILAHHGRVGKNEQLLAQFGYHEAQVLAPPPEMQEGMNGSGSFVQHTNP